jgi:hypothetical protein
VLADVGMPERDGYEVAAFVKRTPHLAHIPVLLLTGAFEPVDEQRASAVGCDGVLAKPFEPHMVITRVKELLADVPSQRPPALRRTEDLGGALLTAAPLSAIPVMSDPMSEPLPVALSVPESRVKTVELGLPAPTAQSGPGEPTRPRESSELTAPPGEAIIDPDAGVTPAPSEPMRELSLDSGVRISRRTPIAVPGFGTPPPPQGGGTLDDYFDRLDAAFATLHQAPATQAPDDSPSASVDEPFDQASSIPQPTAGGFPDVTLPDADALRMAARPAAGAPAPQPAPTPVLAQAFSALFAAEHGDGDAAAGVPSYYEVPAASQVSTEDLVERVTEQVLQRLSDRVVRETVADIVSRVAERLVRDEIDRVKSTIK